jgi:hypothetical protein
MPFKTKAKKQKASQSWAKFMENGQVTYNLGDKKIDSHVHSPWSSLSTLRGNGSKASPTDRSRGPRLLEIDAKAKDLAISGEKKAGARQFEDSSTRAEIAKIGLLALLVIGLQIVLKVSHIGF